MSAATKVAWGAVAAFTGLSLVRVLHGGRLQDPSGVDLAWALRDYVFRAGLLDALILAGLLAGQAVVAAGLVRWLRRPAPSTPPSLGAALVLAVGLLDAAAGAVLSFAPDLGLGPVVAARSAALAVALPALFLHLRDRRGLALLPPALALSLLGVGLWLSPLKPVPEPPGRPTGLVAAAEALARLPAGDDVRRAARLALEREIHQEGPAAILPLLRAESESWARGLILNQADAARPGLRAALLFPDADVRRRALEALEAWAHEPEMARDVLPLLRDSDALVRRRAALFLAAQSEHERTPRPPAARRPEAVAPLRALLRDRIWTVRHAAFLALRHQDPAAFDAELPALLRVERDDSFRESLHAAMLDRRIPGAVRRVLDDLSETCRHALDAGEALADPDAAETWLDLLETEGTAGGGHFRLEEGDAPIRLSDPHRRRLLRQAGASDRNVRTLALQLLSRVDHPQAVAACRAALSTPDAPWLIRGLRRRHAIDAEEVLSVFDTQLRFFNFGYRPGPEDVDLLDPLEERVFRGSPSGLVSVMALDGLARIDRARAERAASRLLEREGVATFPASAVPHLPEAELPKVLDADEPRLWLPALQRRSDARRFAQLLTSDPRNRTELLRMAPRHPGPEATLAIAELLGRQAWLRPGKPEYRYRGFDLLMALQERTDPAAREALREMVQVAEEVGWPGIAAEARVALGRSGDRDQKAALAALLRQGRPGMRGCTCSPSPACRIAVALAGLGEEGVDVLLDALSSSYMPGPVVEALGRTGSPRAREVLQAGLGHASAARRRAAVVGLGHLKDRGTLEAVRPLLDDPSPDVGEAARWAVQEISGEDAGLRLEGHTFKPARPRKG